MEGHFELEQFRVGVSKRHQTNVAFAIEKLKRCAFWNMRGENIGINWVVRRQKPLPIRFQKNLSVFLPPQTLINCISPDSYKCMRFEFNHKVIVCVSMLNDEKKANSTM